MTPEQLLQQLHDIETPGAVSAWPPAPGWWLLAALVLIAIGAALWWWRKTQPRRRFRKQALAQLDTLYQQQGSDRSFINESNALLKRLLHGRTAEPVAALSGDAWVSFLHQAHGLTLSDAERERLAQAPYLPESPLDNQLIYRAYRQWLEGYPC